MWVAGEYTYWSRQVIPPNPTWVKDTIHYQQPRIIYAQEGSAVSASGYALLVYLANNRMEDATSIMKWLQSVRNSIGGWGSTQVKLSSDTSFVQKKGKAAEPCLKLTESTPPCC